MRLVGDTNSIVSGTLWSGAPSRLLDAVKRGSVALYSSPRLLEELGDVLFRPKFSGLFAGAGTSPEEVFRAFLDKCILVDAKKLARALAPDPDDDWVIATALAANADFIVTGDKPLLGVGKVGPIRIVSVAEALDLMGVG